MKHLPYTKAPRELTLGRRLLKKTPDLGSAWYKELCTEAKDAVREQRLREQNFLCAYTELRLGNDNYHIEHLYPQNHCSPEESIDYTNLVLCFPGPGRPCGFGAVEKADWPDRSQRYLFVRPTDAGCESRFRYLNDGQMLPADPSDQAAQETIFRLKLNELEDAKRPQRGYLRRERKEAIRQIIKGMHSVAQVEHRLKGLSEGSQGGLEPFVSAKRQALKRLKETLLAIRKSSQGRQD